jgi:demethylmenaquinone methyltransferase/2-methoxy-6-polyprenyl-1,4-benzoquinol methylase
LLTDNLFNTFDLRKENKMDSMARWRDYDTPFVRRRYDRLAKFFVFFEWLFLLPRKIRSRAVSALELKPGDSVLEVGCGTGRNLALLVQAVGPQGHVYGLDLSEGMLAEAEALCTESGWQNVTLIRSDAAEHTLPDPVDGVIFSLSYATMSHHREVLKHAWTQLRSGGSLVIMDAKLPSGVLGKLLRPTTIWTMKLTVLGNPDVRPSDDLRELTAEVDYEEMQFGTYYICRGRKD